MRLALLVVLLLATLDLSAQQTYVPDNNFEAYLEGNGMGNGIPNDDYVTTANISGVSALIVWGYNIADLTGIEDFTSLTLLFCFSNQLTSLDLSQNLFLSDLRCNNNQLTSLDLSQNTQLGLLFCYNNQLTTLDITQNTNLSEVRCFNNQLTSLNTSQNTGLTSLLCNTNQLTALDVTQNTDLVTFHCNGNQLTALDVTQNTQLTGLRCHNNQITTLDLSQNTELTDLSCHFNQLTWMDVTQSTNLITFTCNNNQLQCLFANNGQNLTMDCSNNSLTCISVVSPPWSAANALYDPGVNFEIDCQVPIDNDVDQNGNQLTAVQNGALYQWLDCDNNYAPIDATSQTFNALETGNFAVQITYNDPCGAPQIDTSSCHAVNCQSYIDNDVNQSGSQLTAVQNGAFYQWLDCNNNYAVIPGATSQTYNATSNGFYAVELTITDACGAFQVDTSSCHNVASAALGELANDGAQLLKITDLLGRETPFRHNVALIYHYSDGTIRRAFSVEK